MPKYVDATTGAFFFIGLLFIILTLVIAPIVMFPQAVINMNRWIVKMHLLPIVAISIGVIVFLPFIYLMWKCLSEEK